MAADVRVKDINEIYAQAKFLEVTNGYSLSSNIPSKSHFVILQVMESDEVEYPISYYDAQDRVDNQACDGVDNSETLIAKSTVDVEDYDNFIDDEVAVDETTDNEYTHDEATNDDFDI
ncbi:hypothetical protein Tco_1455862 [Tanacetum coccineum]